MLGAVSPTISKNHSFADLCQLQVVGGTPILPVYAGEIQVKALGMAVDILDASRDDPVSVEHLGQAGELVCIRPFPSQPLAFYGPGGDAKYKSSYFERFGPQIWCQGDFVQVVKETGGLIMLGRSYVYSPSFRGGHS